MSPHTIKLLSPTGRVQLVPPAPEDDEAVSNIRSHPVTLRYIKFLPINVSIDDARLRRELRAEDPRIVDFHIHVLNEDGISYSFAGSTGIFNIDEVNGSCEVGILVSPERHRGGYGTEALYTVLKWAFEERKMHRATFETAQNNDPMRRWLEKVLGATLEGTRRDCWNEGGGKYTTVCSYSILEWEWSGGAKESLEKSLSRS